MIIDKISTISSFPLFYHLKNYLELSNVFLKLEGLNIAGSIKLTTAQGLVRHLIESDNFSPKTKAIESSSGNLGVALSIVCKEHNIPFTCVIDPNITDKNKKLLEIYGAEIIQVSQPDSNGGFLGSRIKVIEEIILQDPNVVWLNQYASYANPKAHFQKTAREIAEAFPYLDYLFVGAGTGGTLMGCAEYFKLYRPQVKVIGVDAVGSVTFGTPAKKRYIPGIGTSLKPPIASTKNLDDIIWIEEPETISMCRRLLKEYGLFVGGSTGSVLHAIQVYKSKIRNDSTIVAISPDFGDKYIDTVYNDQWVNKHFPSFH